jgi:Mn-containing catalase
MQGTRLQNTVRVLECNPGLAHLMLEQFGRSQGELAAAVRYFTQALAEEDAGRKDMLLDIVTEELSHLEVLGTIEAMLTKSAKGKLAEAAEAQYVAVREEQAAVDGGSGGASVGMTADEARLWSPLAFDTQTLIIERKAS